MNSHIFSSISIASCSSIVSIITLVEGYLALKTAGMLASTKAFRAQMGICLNCKYRKLIQVFMMRDTVDWEMQNQYVKSCSHNPSLS